MSKQTEALSFVNGKWGYYEGCSCSSKNFVPIELPPNVKAIHMRILKDMLGPVTEIAYKFTPHQTAIDVDKADAEAWIKEGIASEPKPAHKGRLTRIPKNE